ncbi:hypothetical protein GCM10027059_23740 [Myceligenerans halotolerans]
MVSCSGLLQGSDVAKRSGGRVRGPVGLGAAARSRGRASGRPGGYRAGLPPTGMAFSAFRY